MDIIVGAVIYPVFLNQERIGGNVNVLLEAIQDWTTLPNELKKPMPKFIFERNFDKFLINLSN